MKNVILFIDTTNRDKVIVRLTVDQTISEKERQTIDRKNQALLPLIEEILQEHSLTVQNLTAIEVNPGP